MKLQGNSRVAVIGKTGSGKTFLSEYLLRNVGRLVVFDVKGNLKNRFGLVDYSAKLWRRFMRGEKFRVRITAPIGKNVDLVNLYDEYFRQIYDTGDCIVYIDEVYGVTGGANYLAPYLTALYTRGRELGVGIVACTQRPTFIPNFILTESEYFFVFRLQLESDRKKIENIVGSSVEIPRKDTNGFWFFDTSKDGGKYYEKLLTR